MPLAVIPDVDGSTLEIQVTVTGVEPDGRFHIRGENDFEMGWCSPEKVLLFDDEGQQVVPVAELSQEEKLKNRIQAAEDALLFLMDMQMGGML